MTRPNLIDLLVLETLGESEAALLDDNAELRAQRDTYRELLSVALSQLHALSRRVDTLRTDRRRLVAERQRPLEAA